VDENIYLPTKQDDTHVVQFKKGDSSNSDEEDQQKMSNNIVTPIKIDKLYEEPAPLLQIKRSFSDSDLRDLKLVINNEADLSPNNQSSRNRLKRASTRYSKVFQIFISKALN
jgi:hypothetical protein